MSTAISVRLPENLASHLDNISKETERSRSFIIQKALESYIEDYSELQIALDRLHDKGDEIVSSKEMRKSLAIQHCLQKVRSPRPQESVEGRGETDYGFNRTRIDQET